MRPLRIFPTDPTRTRSAARTATILVENEFLKPGPVGSRLEIVDFDASASPPIFYDAVDLDHPDILMEGGLSPSESDPRFHQQMVYAVASRTLANFDRALGRRVSLRKGRSRTRLRLFPHAFEGENAFYDRDLHAIMFGYFSADAADPGTNVPHQTIFTCLSHDIIAHEMCHAIVDRLRRRFLEPSNVDVLAFHEGFADIVALLQHFSYRDLLVEELQRLRGDLQKPTFLVELARQFGHATGRGRSLRSALDKPDKRLYSSVTEAHDRGAILVAAVFEGFFETYRSRVQDLFRIATNGTGKLPEGELHPDLVARIATEASRTAQRQLDMCIRAFDYLPPVDVTFGDYLRAIVTADFELNPADEWGQCAALIEGFRRRGIYPEGVTSLAEESLRWPVAVGAPPLQDTLADLLPKLLQIEAEKFSKQNSSSTSEARAYKRGREMSFSIEELETPAEAGQADPPGNSEEGDTARTRQVYDDMRKALQQYARECRDALDLDDPDTAHLAGFDAVFRTSPSGALLIELVAQFIETDVSTKDNPEWGGVPVRGGTTVIFGVDGAVRYVISKPIASGGRSLNLRRREARTAAFARRIRQRAFVASLDDADPATPYMTAEAYSKRMLTRMSLCALHEGHDHG